MRSVELPPFRITDQPHAEVAELVDALASGASGGNPVEVQVLSSVPDPRPHHTVNRRRVPAPIGELSR